MKIYAVKQCDYCGKNIDITHKARLQNKHLFCSKQCEVLFKKKQREDNPDYFTNTCPICNKKFHLKKYQLNKAATHCCSKKCDNKLKEKRYLNKDNPNRKYVYNENFLQKIDTDAKAWLLGWFASDGSVAKNAVAKISIHKKDKDVLDTIKHLMQTDIPIVFNKKRSMVSFSINSKQFVEDIRKHLNIIGGKKPQQLGKLNIPNELLPHFVRGVFEGDGSITYTKTHAHPRCSISAKSADFLQYIGDNMGVPFHIYTDKKTKQNKLEYTGTNCLDFLGKIYPSYYTGPRMCRKYNKYEDLCFWKPCINGVHNIKILPCKIKFLKTDKNAILPKKAHLSDSGYDITIIKKVKQFTNNVVLYDTGIRAECPPGFYLELVGRSSISKTGYILANCLGILDSSYKGNIYVALAKIDSTAPDLELPYKIAQVIPHKIYPFDVEEVTTFDNETDRGAGGFGSTGNK